MPLEFYIQELKVFLEKGKLCRSEPPLSLQLMNRKMPRISLEKTLSLLLLLSKHRLPLHPLLVV